MWHDLFSVQIPVIEKILRTIAVYLVILVIFRVGGRRSMAQTNTMDFAVMILLSNVVQNAIIGDDNSLLGGVIGAVTLVVANSLVDRLAYRYDSVRRLVEGTSTTVIEDGEPDEKVLQRLGLRTVDLDHVVRLQNGDSISEVKLGELDPSGQFIITLKDSEQSASAGDIAALKAQLDRIEQQLATR